MISGWGEVGPLGERALASESFVFRPKGLCPLSFVFCPKTG